MSEDMPIDPGMHEVGSPLAGEEPRELDFDEFAIWIDDLAELIGVAEGENPFFTTERTRAIKDIPRSMKYTLALDNLAQPRKEEPGDTSEEPPRKEAHVYFYVPIKRDDSSVPNIVVRNYTFNKNKHMGPRWEIRFWSDEGRVTVESDEAVDFDDLSFRLEQAFSRAYIAELAHEKRLIPQLYPAIRIPTLHEDPTARYIAKRKPEF